jgi:opacity protein-like surface antigen
MGRKRLLMAAAASALALGVSTADAADIEPTPEMPGWYVSLFGGASWLEEVKTDYTYSSNYTFNHDDETDTGFIVGGAIGTHLMEDLRVELEVAYSENDVDKINYGGYFPRSFDAFGSFEILTFMANIWYDVPLSETLNPYIGGGAGVAIVDGRSGYAGNDGPNFDSSEVEFAFQLGAGLRWHAFDNVTFDVGYRLRGIDGPSFEPDADHVPLAQNYEADWMWSHNVIGGVSFGL